MNLFNQKNEMDTERVKGLALVLGALSDESYSVEGWNEMFKAIDYYLMDHQLHELIEVEAGERLEFSFTSEFQNHLDRHNADLS